MSTASQEPPPTVVLEQCKVSPSPDFPYKDSLPLTYFDSIFIHFGAVERVFFYDLSCSVEEFLREKLGPFKASLSRALGEFRPLAGRLHLVSNEFRCSDLDSVSFVLAESVDDFSDLCGNHPRKCDRFRPLLPRLTPDSPLLALQLTLFPGAGAALGIVISHAIADGATTALFLKTWAALCRRDIGANSAGWVPPPSYDRALLLADPNGWGPTIRQLMEKIVQRGPPNAQEGKNAVPLEAQDEKRAVRATFSFSREQIEKLREDYRRKTGSSECSSFALVFGVVLACLVKAKRASGGATATFGFVFDARARLAPPLPAAYFGNCLGITTGGCSAGKLAGEDGWVEASKEVWSSVEGLKWKEPEKISVDCIGALLAREPVGLLTVAGSPWLGMYQVDFGWGRPRKVEIISIESTSAVSVAEWGEAGRGLEIGMALSEDLMTEFSANVADLLL
ncbi:phenolic glucoside malonyltransferase 1-like [Wolffia australiana]